jgi:hypothetical protein
VAAQQGWLALSAKNWAFQVLFPSFVPALAIFVTVLIGVAMMRRNSTPPTADPLSRILIAGPFVVALWLRVLRASLDDRNEGLLATKPCWGVRGGSTSGVLLAGGEQDQVAVPLNRGVNRAG